MVRPEEQAATVPRAQQMSRERRQLVTERATSWITRSMGAYRDVPEVGSR